MVTRMMIMMMMMRMRITTKMVRIMMALVQVRADKAEEEVADLVKKAQQLETELDITGER
jgi:hypothetical protein